MHRALYVLLGILLVPALGLVGDMMTDGKFKSTMSTGSEPPIEVYSEAMAANLDSDIVDGVEGTDLYTKAEVEVLAAAAAGTPQEAVWKIGARTLPAPAAASDELRSEIMNAPAPDAAELRQIVPSNKEVWEAFISGREAHNAATSATLAKDHSISVERDAIEGVKVHHVVAPDVDPKHENHLFIHVHGGAYVLNDGDASVLEAILIADRVKIPVLSIDYRMPPEHPFPAAVDDVITVYRFLLRDRPAKSMALGGTSAGGGLTLAAVQRFIQLGLEVPGALYAGTPGADLTKTGDTVFTNEGIDRVMPTYDGALHGAVRLYAGDHDLKHPLISPIYGDFQGFPPTYLVTGTRDLLLSDTARTHRKLRAAGVVADLNVYEGMSHAGYLFALNTPESRQVYGELKTFLMKHLQ